MQIEIWIPITLVLIAAVLGMVGLIFGLMAAPAVNEKLGIVCILIPVLVPFVCLLNYRKTRYASNFLLAGLGFFLLASIAFLWFGRI
ncbi:hypothetical protein N8I74_09710 [Chitiniphilus purpureus]|uniref:Uncharacterized protein n=1 Tax=Chitiniphilus purpureus TaxID=2981137 RepID=A0ABY6DSD0_9NEIS|nr:hypothetical protein [Chitiniphilus sp. CD1]UXY17262.1 hypothetical protein N8I74_09710 [Chitiniphilus sp. CD1]